MYVGDVQAFPNWVPRDSSYPDLVYHPKFDLLLNSSFC